MANFYNKRETATAGGGSGDVTAASNFGADNRLIRSNGTLKGVQASGITVDDSDNISNINNAEVEGYLDLNEITTPANPGANVARIYCRDDSGTTKVYFRDSAGTETELGGSGGGASLPVDDTTALVQDPSDNTKLVRIDVGAVATSTTRVITMGDRDVDLASGGTFAENTHTHAAGDVTSGTFADARIAESNVTQHQTAITQVGTLTGLTVSGNIVLGDNSVTGVDTITFTDTAGTIAGIQNQNLLDKSATEVITGSWDFGGAGSLEIPNSATPTVNADGEIAIDTTVTDFSAGVFKYYSGEEMAVVAMPLAELTSPTDGHVVAYNATNDEFELVAQSGGGGSPGGSDGQIQYNNGGAFGGDVDMTWDDTGHILELGGTDATTQLVVPSNNDAATPTLAFGDGDTGFYEVADDQLDIAIGGSVKMRWDAQKFQGTGSGHPSINLETSSAVNATFSPHRSSLSTGVGGAANQVSMIAQGFEVMRFYQTSAVPIAEVRGVLNLGTGSELTISSGAVTRTSSYHTIDTESDASSDELDAINGGADGDILIIRPASSARTIVVRSGDASGNIQLDGGADFTMDEASHSLTLLFVASSGSLSNVWIETSRSEADETVDP